MGNIPEDSKNHKRTPMKSPPSMRDLAEKVSQPVGRGNNKRFQG